MAKKRGGRNRRAYVRFSERDYALLQRMCVLRGQCIGDLLHSVVTEHAHKAAREDWGLFQWWSDECFRISLEETNVD